MARILAVIGIPFDDPLLPARFESLERNIRRHSPGPTEFEQVLLRAVSDLIERPGDLEALLQGVGARIHLASLPAAAAVLGVTVLCFSGIGILAASGILYFKRGDPVTFFIGGMMQLFGGVYFPAAALSGPLQRIAPWVPLTYATSAFRGTLFRGDPLVQHHGDLLALAGFSLVIIPLGLVMARLAIRRARIEGTLAQY